MNTYTYQNEQFNSAPWATRFPVNWVLENSGTCPWPAGLVWAYEEGETFGFDEDPILVEPLNPGEQTTLTVDFQAPARAARYDSVWQLVDSSTGEVVGGPLTFTLTTYVAATPTPAATNTPIASPTSAATATVEQPVDLIYVIQDCEYIGIEYRCQVQITPYGGGGGPYTLLVFDADQPAEYRGPFPAYHFAKSAAAPVIIMR
ncbi:MAG: NBR1-Ig-like domain-containing protein [Chloroflexi bacterium]|nr:NBR1-Ig-like domain-containing protein [Chloroflexota bacterium]